jgi:hypothetical protein
LSACVPVLIGEFGGTYSGADAAWQDEFVSYVLRRGIGSFFWALNPNSGDTGGLLTGWQTPFVPERAKLSNLARLSPTATHVPRASERQMWRAAVHDPLLVRDGGALSSSPAVADSASCLRELANEIAASEQDRAQRDAHDQQQPGTAGGGATAAAQCACEWTEGGAKCVGMGDGSVCWQQCCISPPQSLSSCECSWMVGGTLCERGGDDGSPCWRQCCAAYMVGGDADEPHPPRSDARTDAPHMPTDGQGGASLLPVYAHQSSQHAHGIFEHGWPWAAELRLLAVLALLGLTWSLCSRLWPHVRSAVARAVGGSKLRRRLRALRKAYDVLVTAGEAADEGPEHEQAPSAGAR